MKILDNRQMFCVKCTQNVTNLTFICVKDTQICCFSEKKAVTLQRDLKTTPIKYNVHV